MAPQFFETSNQRWTRNIKLGNATVGYREFPIVADAIKYTFPERRYSDKQSLTGVVYRQVHQITEKETWSFETLARQFGAYTDRQWLLEVRNEEIGNIFEFWDHRANGNYTAHTVAGIVFPIPVKIMQITINGLHNHDPFVDEVTIALRGA